MKPFLFFLFSFLLCEIFYIPCHSLALFVVSFSPCQVSHLPSIPFFPCQVFFRMISFEDFTNISLNACQFEFSFLFSSSYLILALSTHFSFTLALFYFRAINFLGNNSETVSRCLLYSN